LKEINVLLCVVKKNTLSHTLKTIAASIMLLVTSISILPLNLFHHHHFTNKVHCVNVSSWTDISSAQKENVLLKAQPENKYEDCLFCTWQLGAKLTYIIPEVVIFLPDFVKNRLAEFHLATVEALALAAIPNKGPPAFLLF
jgi:hypothetical protein